MHWEISVKKRAKMRGIITGIWVELQINLSKMVTEYWVITGENTREKQTKSI